MKIIFVKQVSQVNDWVKTFRPKEFSRPRWTGVMADGTDFVIVLRDHAWMDRIRGITVTSYQNLSFTPLSLEEEAFLSAKIFKPDQLIVEAYNRQGKNGSLASELTSYRSYQLVLIKDGEKHDLIYVDGYDSYRTMIRNPKTVLRELAVETEKFEKIFGVRFIQETYSEKVTTTIEWVKQ